MWTAGPPATNLKKECQKEGIGSMTARLLVGKDNQIVVSDKISKKERDVTIES